ncbi:hypothetical protein M5689_002425 [Euphorbia peplus]|nr:hypothetical protein M5689_002425 [Euphorbia peplus]
MANWMVKHTMQNEDFDEADVWSVPTETEDSISYMKKLNGHYNSSVFPSSSSRRRLHSSPRKIPGGSSSSSETTKDPKYPSRSSAPVNIPDWSKIYGKNRDHDDDCGGFGCHKVQNFDDQEDDDEDDEELIPPHEWIAKKLSGTQLSSSVYEGIGRTLKGRDLSKLRNAILTKTGFLE